MSRPLMDRIAGAPITWGVDGSPGWGYLMDPDRILAEMVEVGFKATELGPDRYLGEATADVLARLDRFGLELVAGFIPVVLYEDEGIATQLEYFERAAGTLAAGGADIAVVGPDSHLPGYDTAVQLDDQQWDRLFGHLTDLQDVAERCSVTVAVHPHWGMAVSSQSDVDTLIARSEVGLCLDTGHLALAGVDIADLVARAGHRVHHVHLKDLDFGLAGKVRTGEVAFRQAVLDGMFLPLGKGGVDIAGAVLALERAGFGGWYVVEQDLSLDGPPAHGTGPIENARQSYEFLRALATEADSPREDAAG